MTTDLSSQSDLITQLRSRVEGMAERAGQERDVLRAERDQVVQERDVLREEHDQVMKALLHVFPYEHYAEARPDLARMTNEELVIHFVRAGIHDGLSLECSMLCEKLEAMHVEKSKLLVARLSELEVLVSDYSARLSVLQDLFVRLSMDKHD